MALYQIKIVLFFFAQHLEVLLVSFYVYAGVSFTTDQLQFFTAGFCYLIFFSSNMLTVLAEVSHALILENAPVLSVTDENIFTFLTSSQHKAITISRKHGRKATGLQNKVINYLIL